MVFLPEPLYFYRLHPQQSIHNLQAHYLKYNLEYIYTHIQEIQPHDNTRYSLLSLMYLRRSINDYIWGLNSLSPQGRKDFMQYIQEDYGTGRHDILSHQLPLHQRIFYFFLRKKMYFLIQFIWVIRSFLVQKK